MNTDSVVLKGRELRKTYGPVTALDGVTIEIVRGESVALMGPSGSGKSTLLHVLAGILPPTGGAVVLAGTRIDTMAESERSVLRRTRFGFVFQSNQLLPELTALENAALPLMLDGHRRRDAERLAAPQFGALGIGGLEDRRPGQLSGGQAQRVAIARALTVTPEVVFADEPTGALDRATGQGVMDVLVARTQAHGAALVVVTHDPEVAAVCDRVLTMRDGRLHPSDTEPVAA
jgi:putative ABC transport system ATP-binding protein